MSLASMMNRYLLSWTCGQRSPFLYFSRLSSQNIVLFLCFFFIISLCSWPCVIESDSDRIWAGCSARWCPTKQEAKRDLAGPSILFIDEVSIYRPLALGPPVA